MEPTWEAAWADLAATEEALGAALPQAVMSLAGLRAWEEYLAFWLACLSPAVAWEAWEDAEEPVERAEARKNALVYAGHPPGRFQEGYVGGKRKFWDWSRKEDERRGASRHGAPPMTESAWKQY